MKEGADSALDEAILAAHEQGDSYLLAELYRQAAENKQRKGDADAYWFLTTCAYVFALEAGHPDAQTLHDLLKAAGRDE